ncbi:MAG: hypothetical protein EXQ58_13445 [Acidobacteria bacterium]|nr:hypothetical protein [Acidobacteriota bacterium]
MNFKARSHDGFGDDWPISYKDIEPHYDKVERSIGVAGEDIGVWHAPNNRFMKPFALTCGEQLLRRGCQDAWAPGGAVSNRCAVAGAGRSRPRPFLQQSQLRPWL